MVNLQDENISLSDVINVLNDVGAATWKYKGQDDAAEVVIHQIARTLLREVPMLPAVKSAILSATGYSQNAFD